MRVGTEPRGLIEAALAAVCRSSTGSARISSMLCAARLRPTQATGGLGAAAGSTQRRRRLQS